jgi:GGDEF domain-containing protein
VSEGENGQVCVLLLDTDLRSAMAVVDRLMSRFRHYEFSTPIGIEIGAACCPTHGTEVEALRRAADLREGREGTGTP